MGSPEKRKTVWGHLRGLRQISIFFLSQPGFNPTANPVRIKKTCETCTDSILRPFVFLSTCPLHPISLARRPISMADQTKDQGKGRGSKRLHGSEMKAMGDELPGALKGYSDKYVTTGTDVLGSRGGPAAAGSRSSVQPGGRTAFEIASPPSGVLIQSTHAPLVCTHARTLLTHARTARSPLRHTGVKSKRVLSYEPGAPVLRMAKVIKQCPDDQRLETTADKQEGEGQPSLSQASSTFQGLFSPASSLQDPFSPMSASKYKYNAIEDQVMIYSVCGHVTLLLLIHTCCALTGHS